VAQPRAGLGELTMRSPLGQMDITFQLDGADSPVFLAQF
jgi:hypothetical protein